MTDVRERLREESLRLARLSFDRADAGIAANVVDEAKRRALKLAVEHDQKVNALMMALRELHAMVMGECPSLLNEDSGGNARLDADINALLAPVGSVQEHGKD